MRVRTRTPVPAAVAMITAILVAVTGCTAAGATATPTEASPASDTPPIAQAWTAAWNGNDPTELGRLFTADATYRDLAVGKTSTGQDGITAWKTRTDTNIAQVHVTLANAFRNGDTVIIQGTYSGHLHAAPEPFAVPILTVPQLQDDRIAEDADYYNLAELLRQSGLPPNWTPPHRLIHQDFDIGPANSTRCQVPDGNGRRYEQF